MKYQVSARANAIKNAAFTVRENNVEFGITEDDTESINPAELLLAAFAACCLKNIERFSKLLKFEYEKAQINVRGTRQLKPTKMTNITYNIIITSQDKKLNPVLLHKNIQKFGTVYNTLKDSIEISGDIKIIN